MRHLIAQRKLNMTGSHRMAMLRNMVTSLIMHERIKTTVPKAKELKRIADKWITEGKECNLVQLRKAKGFLRTQEAVLKLFKEIGPRFKDRNGGYTRVLLCGNRPGDMAPMAWVELVDNNLPNKIREFGFKELKRRTREQVAKENGFETSRRLCDIYRPKKKEPTTTEP